MRPETQKKVMMTIKHIWFNFWTLNEGEKFETYFGFWHLIGHMRSWRLQGVCGAHFAFQLVNMKPWGLVLVLHGRCSNRLWGIGSHWSTLKILKEPTISEIGNPKRSETGQKPVLVWRPLGLCGLCPGGCNFLGLFSRGFCLRWAQLPRLSCDGRMEMRHSDSDYSDFWSFQNSSFDASLASVGATSLVSAAAASACRSWLAVQRLSWRLHHGNATAVSSLRFCQNSSCGTFLVSAASISLVSSAAASACCYWWLAVQKLSWRLHHGNAKSDFSFQNSSWGTFWVSVASISLASSAAASACDGCKSQDWAVMESGFWFFQDSSFGASLASVGTPSLVSAAVASACCWWLVVQRLNWRLHHIMWHLRAAWHFCFFKILVAAPSWSLQAHPHWSLQQPLLPATDGWRYKTWIGASTTLMGQQSAAWPFETIVAAPPWPQRAHPPWSLQQPLLPADGLMQRLN